MATEAAEVIEQPTKHLPPLRGNAVQLLESRNNQWAVTVPPGTSREDLLTPSLYASVGGQLRQFDQLFITEARRAYWAHALVTSSGHGYARILILQFQPLEKLLVADGAGELPPGFSIEWFGNEETQQYCATRTADGVTITSGHSSYASCLEALCCHASLRR